MLKIDSYINSEQFNVEFDPYIPLRIEWPKNVVSGSSMVYWRTGDFKKNLIEVGFDRNTCKICSITLVLCSNAYLCEDSFEFPAQIHGGHPVVLLKNLLNGTFIDDVGTLEVYLSTESVYVIFSHSKAQKCIVNKDLAILLDDKENWIGFRIKNISAENHLLLRKALNLH